MSRISSILIKRKTCLRFPGETYPFSSPVYRDTANKNHGSTRRAQIPMVRGRNRMRRQKKKKHSHQGYFTVNNSKGLGRRVNKKCEPVCMCAHWLKMVQRESCDGGGTTWSLSSTSPVFVAPTPCNGEELIAGLNANRGCGFEAKTFSARLQKYIYLYIILVRRVKGKSTPMS